MNEAFIKHPMPFPRAENSLAFTRLTPPGNNNRRSNRVLILGSIALLISSAIFIYAFVNRTPLTRFTIFCLGSLTVIDAGFVVYGIGLLLRRKSGSENMKMRSILRKNDGLTQFEDGYIDIDV